MGHLKYRMINELIQINERWLMGFFRITGFLRTKLLLDSSGWGSCRKNNHENDGGQGLHLQQTYDLFDRSGDPLSRRQQDWRSSLIIFIIFFNVDSEITFSSPKNVKQRVSDFLASVDTPVAILVTWYLTDPYDSDSRQWGTLKGLWFTRLPQCLNKKMIF